jgi:hypothetical protein
MNKRLCALALALLTITSSADFLLGCGDKFLNHLRGTRYQRAGLREPAAVLIYNNSGSDLVPGDSNNAALQKAGYRPTSVVTAADFEKTLALGGWDVVLVNMSNAQGVRERLPSSVAVVPVLFNPKTAVPKETKNEYKVILKAPAKSQTLLEAVDEALALRPKPRKGN